MYKRQSPNLYLRKACSLMVRVITQFIGALLLRIIYAKKPEKYKEAGIGILSGFTLLSGFWLLMLLFSVLWHSAFCIVITILIPVIIALWTVVEWSAPDEEAHKSDVTPRRNYRCGKCGKIGPYTGNCPECGSSLKFWYDVEELLDKPSVPVTKSAVENCKQKEPDANRFLEDKK